MDVRPEGEILFGISWGILVIGPQENPPCHGKFPVNNIRGVFFEKTWLESIQHGRKIPSEFFFARKIRGGFSMAIFYFIYRSWYMNLTPKIRSQNEKRRDSYFRMKNLPNNRGPNSFSCTMIIQFARFGQACHTGLFSKATSFAPSKGGCTFKLL